jgi:hypothetical protein
LFLYEESLLEVGGAGVSKNPLSKNFTPVKMAQNPFSASDLTHLPPNGVSENFTRSANGMKYRKIKNIQQCKSYFSNAGVEKFYKIEPILTCAG